MSISSCVGSLIFCMVSVCQPPCCCCCWAFTIHFIVTDDETWMRERERNPRWAAKTNRNLAQPSKLACTEATTFVQTNGVHRATTTTEKAGKFTTHNYYTTNSLLYTKAVSPGVWHNLAEALCIRPLLHVTLHFLMYVVCV